MDGGGRPRALIPGEGVREGLAWQKGHPPTELAWCGARARGGCTGFGSGGVGGRGTGPRSKFRNVCRIFVVSNVKDALWGGGGYPPELACWTGG